MIARRRPLQRETAEIEDLLWLRLKALREQGGHFRKSATFQTFALQFVDHEALLVVELERDPQTRSAVRDRLLAEAGYTILRFPREQAMTNLDSMTDMIAAVLRDRA